jgi:3D (Asp-Asp-Asp) domain-containing protein
MRRLLSTLAVAMVLCAAADARPRHRATRYTCEATAFSRDGVTKAGTEAHWGTAAADPRFLPLGTRIRVSGAGPYSGTYVVADTGSKVDGRRIDLFIPSAHAAKDFGRKRVRVQVLRWGDWERKQARLRAAR